jgi:urease accessory protein
MIRRLILSAGFLFAASAPALAHLSPDEHGSFMAGLTHPLFGVDHILAMVIVGLWAAQVGERAMWLIPAAFVGTMLGGFLLALGGVELPMVEPVILASLVVLGLLVAMAARLSVAASSTIAGIFALFHGYAHGGELGSAGAVQFGLGFAVATASPHAAGIALGLGVARFGPAIARVLGATTAITGVALLVA